MKVASIRLLTAVLLRVALPTVVLLVAAERGARAQDGGIDPPPINFPPVYPSPEVPGPDGPIEGDGEEGDGGDGLSETIEEVTRVEVQGPTVVDVVLVGDTTLAGGRGEAVHNDLKMMSNLFGSVGIRPTVLSGAGANWAAIREHYARIARSDRRPDVVFFYEVGLTRFNPRRAPRGDRSGGQILDLNGRRNPVWRASVRKAVLRARPKRLAVMITDGCDHTLHALAAGGGQVSDAGRRAVIALLTNARGVVDLGAAAPGQAAWTYDGAGSCFTISLFMTVAYPDPDRGPAGWGDVFRATRALVADTSGNRQTPVSYDLGRAR